MFLFSLASSGIFYTKKHCTHHHTLAISEWVLLRIIFKKCKRNADKPSTTRIPGERTGLYSSLYSDHHIPDARQVCLHEWVIKLFPSCSIHKRAAAQWGKKEQSARKLDECEKAEQTSLYSTNSHVRPKPLLNLLQNQHSANINTECLVLF